MQFWEQYCQLRTTARSLLAADKPKEAPLAENTSPLRGEVSMSEQVLQAYDTFTTSIEESYKESLRQYDMVNSLHAATQSMQGERSNVHEVTEKLVQEKKYLTALNSEISTRLVFYKQLDELESEIELLTEDSQSVNKRFREIFSKLEEAISFFQTKPHYAKSSFYLRTYSNLLESWVEAFVENTHKILVLFYGHPDNYYKRVPNSDELRAILLMLHEKSYETAINTITAHFANTRASPLQEIIKDKYNELSEIGECAQLVRMVCELVLSYWKKESSLQTAIFPNIYENTLKKQVSNQFNSLYELVRERLIFEYEVDVLCEITEMIKLEFLDTGMEVFAKIYQDAQERIIYTVGFYISDFIAPPSGETLHPSLNACVCLLGKLINRVENNIFLGLATDAVNNCLLSLKSSAPTEDFIDGHSYLIEHILILRKELIVMSEQINLSYTEKVLDFSDTKQLFWRLIQGQVSLQKEGILAQLVTSAAPKYTESNLDLRKEVESQLSSACQSLVIKVFHEVCNPIITFLVKTRYSATLSYEEAHQVLDESSNKIMNVFPRFKDAVDRLLDDKNKKELVNSTSLQILKAFRQLLSYMEKAYQGKPLPNILHIQTLLQSE